MPFTFNTPTNGKSLAQARREMEAELEEGTTCPCCERWIKVYKRNLNSTMARALVWIAQEHNLNGDWVDVPSLGPDWLIRSNQHTTLAWWKLLVRKQVDPLQDQKHSGLWKPTRRGLLFCNRQIAVPKTVYTLNGEPVEFSDEQVYIDDFLGTKFSYSEVMAGVTLRIPPRVGK